MGVGRVVRAEASCGLPKSVKMHPIVQLRVKSGVQ